MKYILRIIRSVILLLCFSPGIYGQKPLVPDVLVWNAEGNQVPAIRCGVAHTSDSQALKVRDRIRQSRFGSPHVSSLANMTTIPVAFHVIRYDDGGADVDDNDIRKQIDVLNDAFTFTNIRFRLHSIDRTDNTAWTTHFPDTPEETDLKKALAIDPRNILNVYLCDLGAAIPGLLLGYATFPWQYPEDSFMDGVVCLYSTLPNGSAAPYNLGITAVHEVGHWVGLHHTFRKGCSAPGDEVADTPAQASAAYGCQIGRDSCPAPGNDPVENYMNYSDDACMNHFTAGQSARMDTMISVYRPTMLNRAPTAFDLLEPQDQLVLADFADPVLFRWEPAQDEDGDSLFYTLFINGPDSMIQIRSITDTSHIFEPEGFFVAGQQYNWHVEVSDGIATIASNRVHTFSTAPVSQIDPPRTVSGMIELFPNFPNPFNPSTTIVFKLSAPSTVTLEIFDVIGKRITVLRRPGVQPGTHTFVWNGTDASENPVATGIYFYRLAAGQYTLTRKMLLSK